MNLCNNGAIANSTSVPLVVDLDNSLVQTDLFIEDALFAFSRNIKALSEFPKEITKGLAHAKQYLAGFRDIDYKSLPFNQAVLDFLNQAKAEGRKIYLASGSDKKHVQQIANHLGLFDGIYASDGKHNLTGKNKAEILLNEFGEKGFDYVGDCEKDIAIWKHARKSYIVGKDFSAINAAKNQSIELNLISRPVATLKVLLKSLRVHQWAKNVLLFLPLILAHKFTQHAIIDVIIAFFAFSFCASGVYLINDLLDVEADRSHHSKKFRPIPAGLISAPMAVITSICLILAAFSIAFIVSLKFAISLLVYFAITTIYSFWLKRKLVIDIILLALLYTIRVICGAVAIDVVPSEWLLAFSLFFFSFLALVKRYTELVNRQDKGLSDPINRAYKLGDTTILMPLAATCAINSVTVFALYISSMASQELYRRPLVLWFMSPLLLYWIIRILILTYRKEMDDDPVVFAITDKKSMAVAFLCALTIFAAI